MMIMMKHFCCFQWVAINCLLLALVVSSKHYGNPANDIVDIINENRTSLKLQPLNNSPGLGCMALQYVKECKGNCTSNNSLACQPPDLDVTQVFAPNCGVELPTLGTITGHIIGCQHKYLDPTKVFSQVLAHDNRTISVLRNKTHNDVGVGLLGDHHRGYYWCILFSDSRTNSSFVLEDLGQGIKQKKGCYSGTGISCSKGGKSKPRTSLELVFALLSLHYGLVLYSLCSR